MRRPRWIDEALVRLRGGQSIPRLLAMGLDSSGHFFAARRVDIDGQCAWAITIGEQVTLAPDVRVIAHDAATKAVIGYTAVRPVRIGDRTYVGTGAIILPGVTIGADCVIGAGAVVSIDVPDGMVAVGNPARVVTSIDELRERHEALMAASARSEVFPSEATLPERRELQAALRRHGRVYVM